VIAAFSASCAAPFVGSLLIGEIDTFGKSYSRASRCSWSVLFMAGRARGAAAGSFGIK